jgi:hypothetical protein
VWGGGSVGSASRGGVRGDSVTSADGSSISGGSSVNGVAASIPAPATARSTPRPLPWRRPP